MEERIQNNNFQTGEEGTLPQYFFSYYYRHNSRWFSYLAWHMTTFRNFKLNKQLFDALDDLGITEPTPVQEKTIPLLLAGHDLLGVAQTGTGKTAAFGLPLLMKVKYAQDPGPRAVIFTPTRELAMQVHKMLVDLAKYTDLRLVVVYGGTGMKSQIEQLDKGCDILIGTPGRFMDLYLKGEIITKHIKTMILDEADRMMDMGFMPQIRKILEVIPVKRQNMLFSATMPEKVIELSHDFLEFPQHVEITPQATAVETVEQEMFYLPNLKTKINFLEMMLREQEEINRVIVFTRKRSTAENVFKYLQRKEVGSIKVIHANKGQNTRINSMEAFKSGEIRILVTTDVSARGIDVEDVSHVVNFDVPIMYEDYVHRIGRTGRARKSGKAITFCNDAEKYHIKKIEKLIREHIPVGNLPSDLKIEPTPKEEKQAMAKEIDEQKKKEDPNFKGAFHEKKKRPHEKFKNTKAGKKNKRR